MNPILYAFPVFLLTMLGEAWLARRRGLTGYDTADALTSLHSGILSQVSGVFVKLLTFTIYVLAYQKFAVVAWPMNNPALWVVALLLYDLGYYWNHRLNHEVSVMWAAHIVHHSSEYYNLSTALRQSISTGLFGWIFYLPLAVLGVPPAMLAVVGLIDLLYQYWVHTELIGRLGWMERVFVTPSNHRVHHGQNDYCIDKNYGGIFIIWDRIFGTFADERRGEKVVYGVRKPLHSFNPLWANVHYYAELAAKARAERGWRNKLQVWLAPPGGWHGARDPGADDVFDPERFARYDRQTPADVRRYALLHYVSINLMLAHFLVVQAGLTTASRLAYAGIILGSAVAIGALLQRVRWARAFESIRLVTVIVGIVLFPVWFTLATPLLARVAMVLALLYCLTWTLRSLRSPAVAAPAE